MQMTELCDAFEKVYECSNCNRFTKSEDDLIGHICPYCNKGTLKRKKYGILINWEW